MFRGASLSLPIDIALQAILLPLYLWLFVGKVVTVDGFEIIASVAGLLVAPYFTAIAVRRLFARWRGQEWVDGHYKRAINASKLGYEKTATLVFEVTARNSESVIGIAAVILPGRPLVLVAILIGPMIELPVLFAMVRIMLQLCNQLTWPTTAGADPADHWGGVR